ncbi:hypothetical protein BD309DRAFT_871374 [Dichomitus squalens]|nr:hypothetical protein BD309DRAFT_871374 [Dichomitus squalens]TBU51504.1 hypothetical protein BD310DRAFT_834208 [Dichomitus squalens]
MWLLLPVAGPSDPPHHVADKSFQEACPLCAAHRASPATVSFTSDIIDGPLHAMVSLF